MEVFRLAVFESKYDGFSFYANGALKTFRNGRYVTDDKDEIAALEKAADATRVDEPKAKQAAQEAPKQKQAEDAKPAAKRKPSAK